MVALMQIGYVLGLLLVVPLGDLVENRRLIGALLGVAALALMSMAFAPSSPSFLAAAFVAVGIAFIAAGLLFYLTEFDWLLKSLRTLVQQGGQSPSCPGWTTTNSRIWDFQPVWQWNEETIEVDDEGLSEAMRASCKIITFSPHVGISIALILAALAICLLVTFVGIRRSNDR